MQYLINDPDINENTQHVFIQYMKTEKKHNIAFINSLFLKYSDLDVHENKNSAFKYCNDIDVFDFLCSISPDINYRIHDDNDIIFDTYCAVGKLDLAIHVYNTFNNIDIRKNDDHIFRLCCSIQQYDVVQWLMSQYNGYLIKPSYFIDKAIAQYKIDNEEWKCTY